MSYATPDIFPDSYKWLEQQDPSTISEETFYACLLDYKRHMIAQGVDPEAFMDAEVYFQPGDLQLYDNIRSAWSLVPKGKTCPTLALMVTGIRILGTPCTFRHSIESDYQRFRQWCANAKLDPDNLEESKEEKERRLSRDRMRNKRLRDAEAEIKDPEEMALVRLLRANKESARAGRAWFKEQEKLAKTAYDTAVDAAKLQRSQTVSACRQYVVAADQKVLEAQTALDNYRIRK